MTTPTTQAAWTHYAGDQLMLEGVSAAELAAQYGTPLYVYSHSTLQANFAAYQRGMAGRNGLICYGMKANSNLSVLRTFADMGAGFDLVSAGELARVIAAGGDATRCIFSGVGKSAAEMRAALEADVLCFNVESHAELERLNDVAGQLGKRARISLRVNPDVDAKTHPYISTGLKANKFGVPHDQALAFYQKAASLPHIEVVGIDCHIGSQLLDTAPLFDALDRLLNLCDQLKALGIHLHHIDLGGGVGISYDNDQTPDIARYVQQVWARLDARGWGHAKLIFEPGRSLVGNAGVLLTTVEYLKPGEQTNFCIVDAAMNDLLRPSLYQAYHSVVPATVKHGAATTYDVVGPVCESGDWLARARELNVAQGDVLAFESAGAYSFAMASNYNTRGRAAEVMVKGTQHALVRDREVPADTFRAEKIVQL